MKISRRSVTATMMVAAGTLLAPTGLAQQEYNRRVENISISGSTVIVDWAVEANILATGSNMNTEVSLEVNGSPVAGSPVLVTVTNPTDICLPCRTTCNDLPCSLWTIDSVNSEGKCSAQKMGQCWCVCRVPTPFANVTLATGDTVEFSVRAQSGALVDSDLSDDTITITYGRVPAMGAPVSLLTALLIAYLGGVRLSRRRR